MTKMDSTVHYSYNSGSKPSLYLGTGLSPFLYYKYFVIACLLFITGCNPLIEITGTLLTRLTSSENKSSRIMLVAKNPEGSSVEGFQVNIIRSSDSVLVLPSKFTELSNPVVYTLPEECINDLDFGNDQLLIILYHPEAGTYVESVSPQVVMDSIFYFKEIITGFGGERLPKLSLQNYKNFKTY
jgi:hypothetical protein